MGWEISDGERAKVLKESLNEDTDDNNKTVHLPGRLSPKQYEDIMAAVKKELKTLTTFNNCLKKRSTNGLKK
jgi:hypothetical protein